MTELDLDAIEALCADLLILRDVPPMLHIGNLLSALVAEVRRLRAENEELRWDITRRDIDRNRMSYRDRFGGEGMT